MILYEIMLLQNKISEQISLDPMRNRTGDVWHVFVKGDLEEMMYGYKFGGKFCPEEGHYFDSSKMVLDPYAKVSLLPSLTSNGKPPRNKAPTSWNGMRRTYILVTYLKQFGVKFCSDGLLIVDDLSFHCACRQL